MRRVRVAIGVLTNRNLVRADISNQTVCAESESLTLTRNHRLPSMDAKSADFTASCTLRTTSRAPDSKVPS